MKVRVKLQEAFYNKGDFLFYFRCVTFLGGLNQLNTWNITAIELSFRWHFT